jgi:ABC-type branched-subunit amino acid transport system substrate-binding protein
MRSHLSRTMLVCSLAAVACSLVAATTASAKTKANPPFKLMLMVVLSAPQGNLPTLELGVQAAVAAVNKAGGLKGSQIDLTVCDFANTLQGSQACAQKAVDGNFDDVIMQNSFDIAARSILTPAGIPTISGQLLSAYTDKMSYPVAATGNSSIAGTAVAALRNKLCTKIAFASSDLLVTRQQAQAFRLGVQRQKRSAYVGTVFFPLFVTDYAPIAQQLKATGADCVFSNNTAQGTITLARTSVQLGYTPAHFLVGGANFSIAVDGPNLPNGTDGLILGNQFPLPDASSNLAFQKKFFADLQAYGKAANDPLTLTPTTMNGWMFIQGIKALSLRVKGTVTKASLLAAARTQKNVNVAGVLKWSPGIKGPAAYRAVSNGSVFVNIVKSGKVVPLKPYPIDTYAAFGFRK